MRLLVVGGDAAGMSAAARARRRRSTAELEIVAFERGPYTSYGACGLPYYVAGEITDVEKLVARSPDEHRANGIDVRLRHEVVGIDTGSQTVTARDLTADREYVEPYDQLVIATGAVPVRPKLPGVDADGVHGIQTIADGVALHSHVSEHADANQRAVVVGGGYIGLELGEALHVRGMPVTVIEAGSQLLSTLDPDMAALVAGSMRDLGIDVHLDTRVVGFETDADGHVRGVITEERVVPADIVVLGIGVHPNVALAHDAGIALGETGAIATDAHMATNVEGVFAAGDCVESFHRVTKRPAYVPLGTHANKQGRVVGANVTGGNERFLGVVGTAVTRICAFEIGRTGLSEKEAVHAGFDYITATVDSTTRAGYLPSAKPITVKVVAERATGRLLGAQIAGREGAAKRIDVLATAIWSEMTAAEFAQLDLGYAPPFSPVWDSTLVAARKVADLIS